MKKRIFALPSIVLPLVLIALSAPLHAQSSTANPYVGDAVTNPESAEQETIIAFVMTPGGDAINYVITQNYYAFLSLPEVGDYIYPPHPEDEKMYRVNSIDPTDVEGVFALQASAVNSASPVTLTIKSVTYLGPEAPASMVLREFFSTQGEQCETFDLSCSTLFGPLVVNIPAGDSINVEPGPGVIGKSYGLDGDDSGDPGKTDGTFALHVTVTNHARVITQAEEQEFFGQLYGGDTGIGVLAASEGGDGTAGDDSPGADRGGYGGFPGNVVLTNEGIVESNGHDASGLFARSIGGDGGEGGDEGGVYGDGEAGGDGGWAGTVTIHNYGTVTAVGGEADGIRGLSRGGAGNVGGDSSNIVEGTAGNGGAGGAAESVVIYNHGKVTTQGDTATGILGQSMGGGGGDGGDAGALFYDKGGPGTTGGKASTVTIEHYGQIETDGVRSTGILAQSLGGAGGSGGSADSVAPFVAVAIGGGGGPGVDSDEVTVRLGNWSEGDGFDLPSYILTKQDFSAGVIAQSVGGGGGVGGNADAVALGAALSLAVAVGGEGGAGGEGNTSTVNGSGTVITQGHFSTGIKVESIGGGGGNSGAATAVSVQAFEAGVAASVAVSRSGGSGGTGGEVHTNFDGAISTTGHFSPGLFAQSVGGGGGNAGVAFAGSVSAGEAALSVGVAKGGSGGGGGIGGLVNAIVGGDVVTRGQFSGGVLIQSVGGGGGNGGMAIAGALSVSDEGSGSIAVGVGGLGGTGNKAGTVTAKVTTDITTGADGELSSDFSSGLASPFASELFSAFSSGLLVQSVGGSGGNGGLSVAATVAGSGGVSGDVSVGVGGQGGEGGHGNNVDLDYDGLIVTRGAHSTGLLAQSVGGGGGNGGGSVGVALAWGDEGGGSIGVSLGGDGGAAGDGGIESSETYWNVQADIGKTSGEPATRVHTKGAFSDGIVVQSVGGGGGNGGFDLALTGAGSEKLAGSVSVGLGGDGGAAGVGKAVRSDIDASITTEQGHSDGLVVQSVGGGGGDGGFNVSASVGFAPDAGSAGGGVSVGLGGDGAGGRGAGEVKSTFNGLNYLAWENLSPAEQELQGAALADVSTAGAFSHGVVVQSVGGGGGNGGFNISAAGGLGGRGAGAVSVGLGGSGADGGAGALVTSEIHSNVKTTGPGSAAVIAQSVGGGGGNGGFDITVSAAVTDDPEASGAASVAVGLGGSAGGGSSADVVTSHVWGELTTEGLRYSPGLIVQSVGGGGGNGGMNITGSGSLAKSAGAVSVGIGGKGGSGGESSLVNSWYEGSVNTAGEHSPGILVQSVGGGGGSGGMNISGGLNASNRGGAIAVGVGGTGGSGNDSAFVGSWVTGDVTTSRDSSTAIIAQSLAGGGGSGGMNITGAVDLAKSSSASIGVGVGGFGGDAANTAGDVVLNVTGDLETSGAKSSGIVAQSVGGGGGHGGLDIDGALNLKGNSGTGGAISVGVGGFGGMGGNSGNVDLDFSGDIDVFAEDVPITFLAYTDILPEYDPSQLAVDPVRYLTEEEYNAVAEAAGYVKNEDGPDAGLYAKDIYHPMANSQHGIVAQSIAGGGGMGGTNITAGVSYAGNGDGDSLQLGIGGFGGAAGNAGILDNPDIKNVDVDITGAGYISAAGNRSHGILAQSVGGGGGSGGVNITGGLTSDAGITVGIGGFGGAGGTSSHVDVNATTDIYTYGLFSTGLLAQSIGGGGGDGGFNLSGAIALKKQSTDNNLPALQFGIGGFGGAGARSGNVDITQDGLISTWYKYSHGILAQSLAGGGGNGGGDITGSASLGRDEEDEFEPGLDIAVGIGGFAGDGADAGNVTLNSTGYIYTFGDYSRGIYAQSTGGGGGIGGWNFAINGRQEGNPITVGIGGFGGGGGHAGTVLVTRGADDALAGTVETNGESAHGIEATSLGGGGGDAGVNVLLSGTTNEGEPEQSQGYAAQIAIGGAGGAAGNGDTATVINYGDVSTYSNKSHGIFAQSLGGGGGNASFNLAVAYDKYAKGLNVAIGGATGDGGVGKDVTIDHHGSVTTRGKDAFGLFAQSLGGGGGNAGFDLPIMPGNKGGLIGFTLGRSGGTGGDGGIVNVTAEGSIETRGTGSYGVLAQSLGNGGGNSSVSSFFAGGSELGGKSASSLNVSLGVKGGTAGNGGAVTVNSSAAITTHESGSHAIYAQSIGGGGGNGGSASFGALFLDTVAFGLGGTGGDAGGGGNVSVISGSDLRTLGDDSIGILAQSVGGGGGAGGAAWALGNARNNQATLNIGVGGDGGGESAFAQVFGGEAHVENSGQIWTSGERSHGVLAQSVGGGGGIAGLVANVATASGNSSTRHSGTFLIGGSGGAGSAGKTVTVDNTGLIYTEAFKAIGIFAQSVGGGGGNSSTIVNMQAGSGGRNDGTFTYLKAGGKGGAGGVVKVTNKKAVEDDSTGGPDTENTGVIYTQGDEAHGIFALSIGGGGGDGGHRYLNQVFPGTGKTANIERSATIALGGEGGTGGTGDLTTVDNEGLIVTEGKAAHGIVAQSVGGGGGNASLLLADVVAVNQRATRLNFALGGNGGSGNTGGNVTVTNAGNIETFGDDAYGIFAQSVGGGGGSAAKTIVLSTSNPTPKSPGNLLSEVGLGGSGGDGADSGDVTVIHTGNIITNGDYTYGYVAQTVAGGGGSGKNAFAAPTSLSALSSTGIEALHSVTLGGKGSSGKAGKIHLEVTGDIETLGHFSAAAHVQKVDDGGGNLQETRDLSQTAGRYASNCDPDDSAAVCNGANIPMPSATGFAALLNHVVQLGNVYADGGTDPASDAPTTITVKHTGNLRTTGDLSGAQRTQNVAGGGGNYDIKLVVNGDASINLYNRFGSTNSPGKSAGDISGDRTGDVTTDGHSSPGSITQSIGGGGGTHTIWTETVADGGAASPPDPDLPATPANSSGSFGLGASGGAGDNGGDVVLTTIGTVYAGGDRSPGVIVQSVGAGGGSAHLQGIQNTSVSLGGTEGSAGDGGDITLVNMGGVYTDTALSNGVLIQSIGGGGGFVLTDTDPDKVSVATSAANSGNGGDIDFTQTGDIIVRGDQSVAIIAQSLGGGGGVVDRVFAGTAGGEGDGGNITLTLAGDIMAPGLEGVGVWAQSLGSGEQGDITITLAADSTIAGGYDGGIGVWIEGGNNNTAVNHGRILTEDPLAGVDGTAMLAGSGNDRVDNHGLFYGEFDLGDGDNSFINHEDGTLVPGYMLELGNAANRLTNAGALSLGSNGFAQTTFLTGGFTQTATGISHAELDFGTDRIDQLFATGAVDLGGELELSLLNPQLIPAGSFSKQLFSGDLGVTDSGMVLITAPSLVASYSLDFSQPTQARLNYAVDFSPAWLGAETTRMGDYFNAIQDAGSSTALADVVTTLLYEPERAVYANKLEQMSSEFYAQQHGQLVRSSQAFGERMLSCKQAGGAFRFSREGSCIWMQADTDDVDISAYDDIEAAEFDVSRFAMGGQKTFANNVSFGLAVSTEDISGDGGEGFWNSDGTTSQVGMALKYRVRNARFAAAVTYARNTTDTTRAVQVVEASTARAERDATTLGGLARFSYDFGDETYYVRPALDLGFSKVEVDATQEQDAGALNLVLQDNNQTHSWVQPALEVGMDKVLENENTLRVYGRFGVQEFLENSNAKVYAGLEGAPGGIGALKQEVDIGQTAVNATVGIDLMFKNRLTLQFQYRHSTADNIKIHSGQARLSMPL